MKMEEERVEKKRKELRDEIKEDEKELDKAYPPDMKAKVEA